MTGTVVILMMTDDLLNIYIYKFSKMCVRIYTQERGRKKILVLHIHFGFIF